MAPTKNPIVNIRFPSDLLEQAKQICEINGITISEYVRGLVMANVENMPPGAVLLVGVDEGYRQARSLAARIAHAMLNEAQDLLPDSYEEAIARYGPQLSSNGRPPRDPRDA